MDIVNFEKIFENNLFRHINENTDGYCRYYILNEVFHEMYGLISLNIRQVVKICVNKDLKVNHEKDIHVLPHK